MNELLDIQRTLQALVAANPGHLIYKRSLEEIERLQAVVNRLADKEALEKGCLSWKDDWLLRIEYARKHRRDLLK
jgi:hypothetical protein